jgi:NTP pyrophosphatase (non-canonical NTP hydrolase)
MHFDTYQTCAVNLAVFPEEEAENYLPMQLAAEAGEVAGKFAKALRKGVDVNPEDVAYELGDVLWYVANLAYEMGYSLETIAVMNINKLEDRAKRDVIHGEGDKR